MKQFFIPELGDEIILAQDFNFNLVAEYRNETLAAAHNFRRFKDGWVNKDLVPEMQSICVDVDYSSLKEVQGGYREYEQRKKELERLNAIKNVQYYKDYDDWLELNKSYKQDLSITLSKGTVLKIDRIYIRKGQSDYSSVTFKISNYQVNPKIKKQVVRFWLPLKIANQLIVE